MTAFNYAGLAARAATLLERFGAPAVLSRAAPGDYDPNTGEVDDNGSQVYNTTAVRGVYKASELSGTEIRATDVRLYLKGTLSTEPRPGDTIAFDGKVFSVINSNPVKPATVVVLHDVQARDA